MVKKMKKDNKIYKPNKMEVICITCGIKFIRNVHNQYNCAECRRKKYLARQKELYYKNKEERIKKSKEYQKKNRIKTNEKNRNWRLNNLDKVRETQKEWQRNKRKTDPFHRIKELSRAMAKYLGLKKDKCKICNTKHSLEFHHINYIKQIGITVCKRCHTYIHTNKLKIKDVKS